MCESVCVRVCECLSVCESVCVCVCVYERAQVRKQEGERLREGVSSQGLQSSQESLDISVPISTAGGAGGAGGGGGAGWGLQLHLSLPPHPPLLLQTPLPLLPKGVSVGGFSAGRGLAPGGGREMGACLQVLRYLPGNGRWGLGGRCRAQIDILPRA